MSIVLVAFLLVCGCRTVCETIPNEHAPSIRLVNTMADQANITVLLNGKLFAANYPYVLPPQFGYVSAYLDGKPLKTGTRQPLVVLSSTGDTLMHDSITLTEHRNSLFVLGRRGAAFAAKRKIVLFDDELTAPEDNKNKLRFLHGIADLPSLDVYFRTDIQNAQPDFTLDYGDTLNLYRVITMLPGIAITAAGNKSHLIFSNDKLGLFSTAFFITILLRGESNQTGKDPTTEIRVLSDAPLGNSPFQFQTFGARLINATRNRTVSLMPQGPSDGGPRTNLPGQNVVMFDPVDSVTDWAPFNPQTHGVIASVPIHWTFGNLNYPMVIPYYTFDFEGQPNIRYTMVCMDTATLASGNSQLDSMILLDTITHPQAGMGRIRFGNFSPDHVVSFTIDGHLVTMNRRGVVQLDLHPGHYTPTETSTGTVLEITVPDGAPASVFFYPSTTANVLLYSVAKE
jgi:hypothetical protein